LQGSVRGVGLKGAALNKKYLQDNNAQGKKNRLRSHCTMKCFQEFQGHQ